MCLALQRPKTWGGGSRSPLSGAHRMVGRQTEAQHLPNKSQGVGSAKMVKERFIPPGRSGEATFVLCLGSWGILTGGQGRGQHCRQLQEVCSGQGARGLGRGAV